MDSSKVSLNQLISNTIAEANRLGFSGSFIWRSLTPGCGAIRKYYKAHNTVFYSPEMTIAALRDAEERQQNGGFSRTYVVMVRVAARRLNEFYLTGTLHANNVRAHSHYILNGDNERLVEDFILSQGYGDNTDKDATWAVRKYLYFFEQRGHTSLEDVTIDDVRDFIMATAAEVRTSTLHDIYVYLRYFHVFLKINNIPAPDCEGIFSYTIHREMPIQGCVSDEELEKILNVIDVTTESGCRNYAIISLTATTGLRACDIIRLKLRDIDWRNGMIRIVQSKTDQTVDIPLMPETSKAIQDYILNYRPKQTDCQQVFLRCSPPKTEITDASTIGTMFKDYQCRAGIQREAFDGKGFHGLRRRLAKKLLTSGTPAPTIAQILGHEDVGSTRQYMVLDSKNLKECALTFDVIPIRRSQLKNE